MSSWPHKLLEPFNDWGRDVLQEVGTGLSFQLPDLVGWCQRGCVVQRLMFCDCFEIHLQEETYVVLFWSKKIWAWNCQVCQGPITANTSGQDHLTLMQQIEAVWPPSYGAQETYACKCRVIRSYALYMVISWWLPWFFLSTENIQSFSSLGSS